MNWQTIIQALLDAGHSQAELGALAGCSQNTIWMLLHGKTNSPAYQTGQRLISLYEQICGPQQATA